MPTLFSADRDYTDHNLGRGGRVGLSPETGYPY
jgi:hypothetical protein